MNRLNTDNITKPYIDQDYYTNIFKPNKNAMIIGSFNNVDSHIANFDAFRNRASELVDRMVNNKISEAGGIDYVSPTPQMFLRKATAAVVQWWYINGYTVTDVDNMLNLGSLNVRQIKNNKTFRQMIGLDALLLIQKSGMWDNRVFGVDVTKKLQDFGIDINDILLMTDALAIFQQKNEYDDNFHVDIDYSNELTGQAIDRWIKIIETKKQNISFNITGGAKNLNARALLFINKDDFSSQQSDAFIYTTKILSADQKPDYFVKNENGKLSVYIKVEDDIDPANAHFLISDIYADDAGEYKLFGSQTTSAGLTKLNKKNILQSANITTLENTIKNVLDEIKIIEQSITTITDNKNAISLLQKESSNYKSQLSKLTQTQTTLTSQMSTAIQNIAQQLSAITSLENSTLKKNGSQQIDKGFVPTRDYDIVYFKIITDMEEKLRKEFTQLTSGFETEWSGNEAFVVDANSKEGGINVSKLVPQSGASFNLENNKQINITFEFAEREETIVTRIVNDGKWDEAFVIYPTNDTKQIFQTQLNINGILKLRVLNENMEIINWTNIKEIPTLTYLFQINGNIYSISSVDVDDLEIQELEGVTL